MKIQWYPGHMAKAFRNIKEDLKLVDLLIELRDARAPLASANPTIKELAGQKKRLIILNKADLADEKISNAWCAAFRSSGLPAVLLDSRNTGLLKKILPELKELSAEKRERDRKRGILNERPLKIMIVGIPNIGKSTFINSLYRKASAKTGDKPGVTKGNQWINVNDTLLLLDTPGVLWPKFDDPAVGQRLALSGAISDQVFNMEELSLFLISYLEKAYPEILGTRYGYTEEEKREAEEAVFGILFAPGIDPKSLGILNLIAKKRGCVKKGGIVDTERAAKLLTDDFRSGKLGRISLEEPKPGMLL